MTDTFPFCPNPCCTFHTGTQGTDWYYLFGRYTTKTFGDVFRYRCSACGKTFSTQTFSLHYYAKRIIDLEELERLSASSMSTRALARHFHCTCDSINNRIDRLMRQGIALHADLRTRVNPLEAICFDGLVNFDTSQFFPNDIGISITAWSQFILGLSHATVRRSGTMTARQKTVRDSLYATCTFERGAIVRSFTEHLDLCANQHQFSRATPLLLITDEKQEYTRALYRHRLFRKQDETHRVAQLRVNSKLPRDMQNPLFASNYIDREIRKDMANFRRETTCITKHPANGMSRLAVYMGYHNYVKKFRIREEHLRGHTCTHAERAGIARELIARARKTMFTVRAFLSRIRLLPIDEKIWKKQVYDPKAGRIIQGYLPKFALQ